MARPSQVKPLVNFPDTDAWEAGRDSSSSHNSTGPADINWIPPLHAHREITTLRSRGEKRMSSAHIYRTYKQLLCEAKLLMTGCRASRCCCLLAGLPCSVPLTAPMSPGVCHCTTCSLCLWIQVRERRRCERRASERAVIRVKRNVPASPAFPDY